MGDQDDVKQGAGEGATRARDRILRVIKSDDAGVLVGGYGVVFGGKDLVGDTFLASTNFMPELVPVKPIFYEHRYDEPQHALGKSLKEEIDEYGIWVEAQLDKSREYVREVLRLVDEGVLGWSSGSVPHLVDRKASGLISQWPIVEYSLTVRPAEPRTLGVEQIKAMKRDLGLSIPEAAAEAGGDAGAAAVGKAEGAEDPQSDDQPDMGGGGEMAGEVDVAAITETVKLAAVEAATVAAKAAVAESMDKLADVLAPVAAGGLAVPNIKRLTGMGFSDEPTKAWMRYIRHGDHKAYKAAMQGQTDDEGGYGVPDGFYGGVVAKRDELSVARRAGARVIPTSLDRVLVPQEGTSASAGLTAEEAAVTESEPTLAQGVITVYKGTHLIKISEELLEDEKANLYDFLLDVFARAQAAWENTYFITGSGTSQPYGALTLATLGKTTTGTNAITAAEVIDLMYALDDPYAQDASRLAFVSRRSTEGYLRGLTGNPFAFGITPQGAYGPQGTRELLGSPIFNTAAMGAIATGVKVMLYGDWSYYWIAERRALSVRRLDELYRGTGQIGLLASWRVGGLLAQAEAMQYMVTA